jgi:integrase
MAKSYSTLKMDTPTARSRNCEMRHAPYWEVVRQGCYLGYRRGKKGGTWFAKYYFPDAKPSRRQIDLGSADDNGKPDGLEVLSYDQAKTKADDWFKDEAKRARGVEVSAGPYTVRQCMTDYLNSYEKSGGRAKIDTERIINAHILPTFGDVQVAQLTRSAIQKWFENLADTPARVRSSPHGEQKFKPAPVDFEAKRRRRSTANRILTVLKAALNKAVDLGTVTCSVNPWRQVKPFRKADGSRMRFLSIEEQKQFVEKCEGEFQKLVQAALFTGARYGELVRLLHVRDFDERTGQIFITAEAKSEVSRHIVLSDEGAAFFKSIVEGRKKSELMFQLKEGKPWGKGDQIRLMKRAVKAAKIEDGLSFHELRHTYASTLVMAGVPLTVIAEQLGHKGTRMVDKHYGHLAKGYVMDTIRKLSPTLNISSPQEAVESTIAS